MNIPTEPIPRPASARWNDLRLRHLPWMVYVLGLIAIIYLWNVHWTPSTFTGEVQGRVANVISPMDGLLAEVVVTPFSRVEKGQVLATVIRSPEAVEARLATVTAELNLQRARMEADARRNEQDLEALRIDQLSEQVDLAIARSRLRYAEHELARQKALHQDRIQSTDEYEIALDNRDALIAEIKEREALVHQVAATLARLETDRDSGAKTAENSTINEAINAQAEVIRQSGEYIVRAPIAGLVTKLARNDGEAVVEGESLLVVSSEHSENIVGYVRQPVGFVPKVGEKVVVRTRRASSRQAVEATIVAVGSRLEFFSQPLRVRGFDSSQERGLPVLISAPEELALYPGELVDLAMQN